MTSNDGFSVVAPMSTMSPASTRGRKASCCALLKRWISSTKTIVRRPVVRRRRSASAITSLISLMPDEHRAERHESRLRRVGDEARERGLAGARRAPEDDRLQQVALDRLAQRLARAEQLLLADELVERARPHPLGERRARCVARRRFVGKQRSIVVMLTVTKAAKSRILQSRAWCLRVFVAVACAADALRRPPAPRRPPRSATRPAPASECVTRSSAASTSAGGKPGPFAADQDRRSAASSRPRSNGLPPRGTVATIRQPWRRASVDRRRQVGARATTGSRNALPIEPRSAFQPNGSADARRRRRRWRRRPRRRG